MTGVTPPGDRRAQMASLAGLVIQVVLFGALLAAGLWSETRSDALVAVARHLAGGILIWIILLLIFTQRRRSRMEDLETERLQRAQASGLAANIFDVGDETLLLERRRLAWTYKFLIPTFTILFAIYHIVGGFLWWQWPIGQSLLESTWHRAPRPFIAMVFAGGAAFVCFIYARYIVGMARQPGLQMLRAGGSYLMGNALSATLLVAAMALAGSKASQPWAEPTAAYIVRFATMLLGVEAVVNFILELYRPRRAEEDVRPAFDSRLLALFSEPGGVVRSIAETINYQFGFEVSGTWFYKLLQRSIFPLTVLTLLTLVLLSSIVIIDVDEEAYVERFGSLCQAQGEPIGPGFHLKYPWPIDQVVRARTQRMRAMTIGSEVEEEWKKREHADEVEEEKVDEHELSHALLWTEQHDHISAEMLVIVATADAVARSVEHRAEESGDAAAGGSRSEGVNLLMLSAAIDYRIKNTFDYLYRFADPAAVLRTIAYQELSDYAASHDPRYLMGIGRESFRTEMQERLQKRCDAVNLGIGIQMVSLQDAHPPPQEDVAATFQRVISAEIQKTETIARAKGAHDRILTLAAGSVERAKALDEAIQGMDRTSAEAERTGAAEAKHAAEQASRRVEKFLFGNTAEGVSPASGGAAATIAQARANSAKSISEAESKLRQFQADVAAYESAPRLFTVRRTLEALKAALPGLRKIVFTGRPAELIVEYETEQRSFLDLSTDTSQGTVHIPH